MTRSILAVLVTLGILVTARAQEPAALVFTAQQATAGKALYAKSCASCHMPDLSGNSEIPALAGPAFKETWGKRSTKDLFDYMSAAMPYGGPSLTVDEYESIIAYVLQFNGAAAGEEELTASTAVTIASLTSPAAK